MICSEPVSYTHLEEFSDDEIRAALRANVLEGSIVPVLMGSNILARGMYTLMTDIVKYLPSPEKRSLSLIHIYRPDCQCIYGMAREVAAVLGKELKAVSYTHLDVYKRQGTVSSKGYVQ